MRLQDIGEFGLIEHLAKGMRADRSVRQGIGDDAAVLALSKDRYLLATTDMLIEDIHFKKNTARPEQIGWKALCCGVSDIAAMGGVPRWALISCGLPQGLRVNYADKIYKGIKKAAARFGIHIVGGDTSCSKKILMDVVVLGEARHKGLVLRNGARGGDFIFVTGALGGSRYGRHLNFIPRLKESQILTRHFTINAMIDLSDGLSSDLGHIAKQSNTGAMLYEDLIPKSKHCSRVENALSDGEDFELLFTMSKKEGFKLLDIRDRLFDIPITRIGTVTDKKFGMKIVDIFGRKRDLRPRGFRHF